MTEVAIMSDGSTAQRLGPSARRSKIVCTIGRASESPEMLTRLIDAGMDVTRLTQFDYNVSLNPLSVTD